MTDAPNHTESPRHPNTSVVLLAPELFATPPDTAALLVSLSQPHTRVRLLVRLNASGDLDLAEALARSGVDVQLLVPADLALRPTALPLARLPPGMPPESKENDTNDLALALSDGLFAPAVPPDRSLVRVARKLKKPFVIPGEEPPPLAGSRHSAHRWLDPEVPGWHRWFRWLGGRLEQFALELWAFNWRGREHDGFGESRKRLRACLPGKAWRHSAYFAPERWKALAPDRAAVDATSPIVANFDRLDRSALHGSRIHRDLAWANYGAAAFAVFFAVAGYVAPHIKLFNLLPEWVWPAAEFLLLLFILATTFGIRIFELQDRWTACRFGAEQLRIARTCLPLLVVPSALCSLDEPAKGDHSLQALAEVKRAVRDQGLPQVSPTISPADAANWLVLVVADQIAYHHTNHHKLHCAEQRLSWVAEGLFLTSFIAVCSHYWLNENPYLLLFTAAGPAFAGAVHGLTTRLGFVHRIDLSREAEKELSLVHKELQNVIDHPASPGTAWNDVRKLAFRAAEAMGRENTSWHSQVRRQKDELT